MNTGKNDVIGILNKVKEQAIKEFAEKLKDVFVTVDGTFECSEVEEHIDNLVKEMTGGDEE